MNNDFLNQISGRRIQKTIEDIQAIVAGDKGNRIVYPFSGLEDAIFKYIKSYAYELNKGYTVLTRNLDFYEDAFGNLYVLLDSDKDKCVAIATHVDGENKEGNIDGYLGAAVGLEIMRVLFDQEVNLDSGFCLMVFRAGNAAATGLDNLGSKVAAGKISVDEFKQIQYGLEKKFPLEEVLKFKQKKIKKIRDGLEVGFMYEGRYKVILEIARGEGNGVASGCVSCNQEVLEKFRNLNRKLFTDELNEFDEERSFDVDSYAELGVKTGVVLTDGERDGIEWAAKLMAALLYDLANVSR